MRKKISFVAILFIITFFSSFIEATQVELQITKQVARRTRAALASFKVAEGKAPSGFEETLEFDLNQSSFFEILKNKSAVQSVSDTETPDTLTQGSRWHSLGAEIVIKGIAKWNGQQGSMDVYAFDVASQNRIFAKRYPFDAATLRKTAHTCANDLVYRLTGEQGIAGTRIAYVAGGPRGKELFVCDADGKNVRQLTQDGSIILGVSWNPTDDKLLYTSFKEGQPRLYIHDLAKGQRQRLAAYPGLNAAAKFSPDGRHVAMVLSKDGNPEIYIGDLTGRNLQRLTQHPGVDSSPCWSPDGQKIAFVSDRSGKPHIYILDLKGGPLRRLTKQGSYNASPSWSPKGDKIAFSSDMYGGFKICVLDLNDESISIVSQEGGEAEEPEWAPDGRHIIYSSKVGGIHQLFMTNIVDGQTIRLTQDRTHHLTPAWSF